MIFVVISHGTRVSIILLFSCVQKNFLGSTSDQYTLAVLSLYQLSIISNAGDHLTVHVWFVFERESIQAFCLVSN